MYMATREYINNDYIGDYIDIIFNTINHFDKTRYNLFVSYNDRPYIIDGIVYCKLCR